MLEPENKLFALKDGWASPETKEQQRLKALSDLGLRQSETIPVFEEATQTAAHFLEAPISILGFIDQERHWFKSAVGLSRLGRGLMNHLAQSRQLLRRESFCSQVVDSYQFLRINDTHDLKDSVLAASKLVQDYGIRAYLGAPLIDASGHCLGALAVMDLVPRNFTDRDIEFLQIIARWSMSEFERNRLLQGKSEISASKSTPNLLLNDDTNSQSRISAPPLEEETVSTKQLKLELLGQLTQELRTPLTSVLGMASVLGREIYGPLTTKQREYVEIIQHSGRYLLSLVNEITELGTMADSSIELNLAPVDIEMLCQQAINTLEEAANRREQDIRLSVEPGRSRIWPLDKDKVRQILYHLIFSVIQLSATGSVVRIHVSYKENTLNITVWVSHPWLGDGMTDVDPYFRLSALPLFELTDEAESYNTQGEKPESSLSSPVAVESSKKLNDAHSNIPTVNSGIDLAKPYSSLSRESLGLLLSCQLAELHGGQISIQGSPESGYRYVLALPLQLATNAPEAVSDKSS